MENSKAKSLIIVVLIILLLACLGVAVWQYLSINKTISASKESQVTIETENAQLKQEIVSLKNKITTKEEEISNLKSQNGNTEKIKYKYIVEDAVNEYKEKVTRSGCPDQEWLSKRVRLPKINIDTNEAKKLNEEIMKINKEVSTYNGGGDLEIDYTYKYIPSKNLLYILITRGVIAHCATGNVTYISYFYDVKKDKMLTSKELLNEYKIDMEAFKDSADEELKEYLGEDRQAEEYKDYKKRLDEIMKEESYTVFNADQHQIEVYFRVDLGGFTMKI